jgi:hypothetical protein
MMDHLDWLYNQLYTMGRLGFWFNQLVEEDSFPYLDHMVPCKKDHPGFWYNQVYTMDH